MDKYWEESSGIRGDSGWLNGLNRIPAEGRPGEQTAPGERGGWRIWWDIEGDQTSGVVVLAKPTWQDSWSGRRDLTKKGLRGAWLKFSQGKSRSVCSRVQGKKRTFFPLNGKSSFLFGHLCSLKISETTCWVGLSRIFAEWWEQSVIWWGISIKIKEKQRWVVGLQFLSPEGDQSRRPLGDGLRASRVDGWGRQGQSNAFPGLQCECLWWQHRVFQWTDVWVAHTATGRKAAHTQPFVIFLWSLYQIIQRLFAGLPERRSLNS